METVVLAANADGLRLARAGGGCEKERYVLDGEREEWVDLRLAAARPA
ncbi:GNAT family N-acetyltransferase OS=Streptomyces tendae OX=1932 GN=GUR47_26925 PE=4 SV=1 [Streptomyces tendae]